MESRLEEAIKYCCGLRLTPIKSRLFPLSRSFRIRGTVCERFIKMSISLDIFSRSDKLDFLSLLSNRMRLLFRIRNRSACLKFSSSAVDNFTLLLSPAELSLSWEWMERVALLVGAGE